MLGVLNVGRVEQFVKARKRLPKRVALNFDATDIPLLHGMQEARHWHGHCRACGMVAPVEW